MIVNRTIEDFVEDMVSDGKNLRQILAVALSTHWRNTSNKFEVEKIYRKLMKRIKKG